MPCCMKRGHARVARALALDTRPWHHWLVVYGVLLPFFSAYRGVALPSMLRVFATREEATAALKGQAVVLGFFEDATLVTILLVLLSACDFVLGPRRSPAPLESKATTASAVMVPEPARAAGENSHSDASSDEPIVPHHVRHHCFLQGRRVLRALVHFLFVATALVPFAVDNVLLRTRGMRFTFDFVNMYIRELDYAAGVESSKYEVRVSTQTTCITLAAAVVMVAINMLWLDLSRWHLAKLFVCRSRHRDKTEAAEALAPISRRGQHDLSKDDMASEADYVSLEDGIQLTSVRSVNHHRDLDSYVLESDVRSGHHTASKLPRTASAIKPAPRIQWKRVAFAVAAPIVLLTVICSLLLAITHHISPVISATGMNATLNELFRLTVRTEFIQSLGNGKITSAADYIHTDTETYELFQDDVLYRKTTGFKGPLAFDVAVNASNPPNVLVLVVESFRYLDSHYMIGNRSDALLKKTHNISLTPNFDRWAKRGIAFRNLWSSWQTSRSVESILFGQVPFDDITDTGTTTGRTKVELHGMPQLFHAKGYETTFTSGVRLKYDQWNTFLPAHGFDYVMGSTAFKAYGEKDYGLKPSDWKSTRHGGQDRASFWGVHDDVTFDVLGDLLVNKTLEQESRQRRNDPKKPFFINHYTISSHTPFIEYPAWFENETLPDFSALAEGHGSHAKEIARYTKLRYFEDLALGRFLDRMQQQGVLNDTIVVITGDHGQSPEHGLERPDSDEIATTRVAGALLAEGRLGEYAGMVYDDAAEHYDFLNTLADIVGVPDGGFLQSGVGRSLKRAVPFGSRPVWSNNPMRQLAVVKGHERLSFDRRFNMIELYNAENDPEETHDLLPSLSADERRMWETLRDKNRQLSRYFRVRWDKKCISKVHC